MKLKKLLSAAVIGVMTIGCFSGFTSSLPVIAASNPLGMKLTCDQTDFSMDQIKAGASVRVYVDLVENVSESAYVGSLEFKLISSAWGKVDPVDLVLSNDNAIGTKNGFNLQKDHPFNEIGTMVISKWTSTKPSKAGYVIQDYNTISTFKGYMDDGGWYPGVIIISDSAKGFLRSNSSKGRHIAEFNVNFPKNLAKGKYTISFADAKSMVSPDGVLGSNVTEMVNAPVTQSITFNIGVDKPAVKGDANYDGKLNVRDAAYIAAKLAQSKVSELPSTADFNGDGKISVRDAAAIAKHLASK